MRKTLVVVLSVAALIAVLLRYLWNCTSLGDDGHVMFIGLYARAYGEERGIFPDDIRDTRGKPLLSWRVKLLSYMGPEGREQYRQFHLDEPWDSTHNLEVGKRIPECYRDQNGSRFTPYLAVTGELAAFRPGNPRRWFPRRAYKGLLVVTASHSDVFWTEPRDMAIEDAKNMKNLRWNTPGPFGMGPLRSACVRSDGLPILIGDRNAVFDEIGGFEFAAMASADSEGGTHNGEAAISRKSMGSDGVPAK